MRRLYSTLLAASMAVLVAFADAPNGSGTYYLNANGTKGAALKTALCGIIYNRTEKSYDYLWTAFKTTDVRTDGKIWDMYSDNTSYVPGGSAQGANYSAEGDSYNREHSFPKSWFGGEVMPMYTDLHHMYPTDGFVNNKRSNYPFGTTNGNTYKSHNSFSKLGSCTYSGYTGTVFEPADEYKGDFARTYFYMITCYEEKLADWYALNASGARATIDGSTYPGFQIWQLNMLLAWAAADPVSSKEINRNNAVAGIQGNRNPFIDYPGLEQYIWGSKKDDTFSYNSYVQPTDYTGYNEGGSSGSGGSSGGQTGGDDVADALSVTGWAGYTTNEYSAANTDKIGTSSTTGVSYAMQVYNGSTGAVRGNQSGAANFSCRNTTTYPGFYIKEVKLTVKGTGTIDGAASGCSEVYFGTSEFAVPPSGTATASNENESGRKTLTWTNTDTSNNYFILYNLRTNGTTSSAVVTVTWGLIPVPANDPSFNNLADVSVDYGSTLTLTKGTTGTPNFVTDGTVTLTSLNEAVATVNGLTITPVAVGTATISVSTSATTAYNAGSVMFPITVNAPEGKTEAAPSTETVTFDFTTNDWGLPTTTTNGQHSYTSGDYTITLNTSGSTSSNGYKFNDNYLLLGKSEASLTLPAFNANVSKIVVVGKSGASASTKQNIFVGGIAVSTETTGANKTNTYKIESEYQAAGTIYKLKVTNSYNTQIQSIIVYMNKNLTAKLNGYGYASFCSEYPLDFSNVTDFSAWKVTGVSGEAVTFAQVTGSVKGGTGLILKGEAGATVTIPSANSTNVLSDNLLEGTQVPTYVELGTCFGLKGNSFVPVAASIVPSGKALLPASAVTVGGNAKSLLFMFEDDDPTSINEELRIKNEGFEGTAIFNLAGQRLEKLQRGINIVNGKKVLVK